MADFNTVDTTRIPYDNASDMAVEVTRMIWPAAPAPDSPKTVILVPDNDFHYAFMAASLIHDPIMGTILLTSPDELNALTREEIIRLKPSGSKGIPQIIAVGSFRPRVVRDIEKMGYTVIQIRGKNVFDTAASVARFRLEIPPESADGPVSLFIISAEAPYEGLAVPYYSAHSGVPILLTQPKQLPPSTAKVLKEMAKKNIYIVGSRRSVSERVMEEIINIVKAPVRRIAGSNPYDTAIVFARYRDSQTRLGWNRNQKGRGDAFTFCNAERWDLAIAAVGMAHQGKHTPLLLVGLEEAPNSVVEYLEFLKPSLKKPPVPPFMHCFILGSEEVIAREAQIQIEAAMKIDIQ